MNEWFQSFFFGLYGRVLRKQFKPSDTADQVRIVRKALGLRKGRRVLDVPCGMGRLTIPLAETGLRMTGVDLVPSYIRRARRDAKRARVDAQFVVSDMRQIAFEREFHAALNWFGSFGYFSAADNFRFARKVFAALKPRGRFLIEGINKSWVLRRFRKQSSERRIGGVAVSQDLRWDAKLQRIRGLWTLRRGSRTERHRVSMRVYNGTEIRNLLEQAGFREIKLYGHPPLRRFSRHCPRFVAVGTRPRCGATGRCGAGPRA